MPPLVLTWISIHRLEPTERQITNFTAFWELEMDSYFRAVVRIYLKEPLSNLDISPGVGCRTSTRTAHPPIS